MFCSNCGVQINESARFCTSCGSEIKNENFQKSNELVGYSPKINNPAFEKYIKSSNKWTIIFTLTIAVIAVIAFPIYGNVSGELKMPNSLFYGMGIGGMFLIIAFFQLMGRRRSKTFDGVVVNKKVEKKRRQHTTGNDDYYWQEYLVYTVSIKSESGKTHTIRTENDDTVYNYYKEGDRVRHHGALRTYEKFDKSGDTIIFCNACACLNNIRDDICVRCECPLLK